MCALSFYHIPRILFVDICYIWHQWWSKSSVLHMWNWNIHGKNNDIYQYSSNNMLETLSPWIILVLETVWTWGSLLIPQANITKYPNITSNIFHQFLESKHSNYTTKLSTKSINAWPARLHWQQQTKIRKSGSGVVSQNSADWSLPTHQHYSQASVSIPCVSVGCDKSTSPTPTSTSQAARQNFL